MDNNNVGLCCGFGDQNFILVTLLGYWRQTAVIKDLGCWSQDILSPTSTTNMDVDYIMYSAQNFSEMKYLMNSRKMITQAIVKH